MIPHSATCLNGQSSESLTTLLDWALDYARRGWTIIPVRGKKAVGKWRKYQTTRPDGATLRAMFGQKGVSGLAVVLGPASNGLGCRDFDDLDSYKSWAAEHPDLARTLPTVETCRGRHVYFPGPEGFKQFGDGEYRGDAGHYCLLPPSRHPDGPLYSWLVPLPDGDLPAIDPMQEGLLLRETQNTQEDSRHRGGVGCPPPPSLCPELSVSSELSVFHDGGGDKVEDIIKRTLPTREGERARRLFDLARLLKSMPEYADADPRARKPILRRWHQLALPVIGTKPLEETWIDFLKAWPKVKFPVGLGPLDELLRRARDEPPPDIAFHYEQPGLRQLVALTALLQRNAGDRPFFLSCRTAAQFAGSPATASRWLFLLEQDGVLKLVSKGSQGTRKASEFRYNGG
jgi:hypothetical protein